MDYSHFGTPSAEWLQLVENDPAVSNRPTDLPATEFRRITNAGRETASEKAIKETGVLDLVDIIDFRIPTRDGETIPARAYRSKKNLSGKLPTYLYFHGGGFLFGTLSSEDAACAKLASEVPVTVFNVCYRHTPEYKHPTQAADAWDAYEWLKANIDEIKGDLNGIIVGGISAGATLASSIVLKDNQLSRGKGRLRGQLLCIPWLYHPDTWKSQLAANTGSYSQNKEAPVLPLKVVELFTDQLGDVDPTDLSLFTGPAKDQDLVGMPKTVVLVAGMDPLRDEALLYEQRLRTQGVPTRLTVFPGVPHGFHRFAALPSTSKWSTTIANGLQWIINNQ